MTTGAYDAAQDPCNAERDPERISLHTGREKPTMTAQELSQMSLESLLYYVLVGPGRKTP